MVYRAERLPPRPDRDREGPAPCIEHGLVGDKNGYALTRRSLDGAPKRQVRLHRLAYTRHHDIPYDAIDGQLVRHICDNPRCIEPTHLVLGSPTDNSRDMVERGRSLRNERHPGAKITDEDAASIRRRFIAGTVTLNNWQRSTASPLCRSATSGMGGSDDAASDL